VDGGSWVKREQIGVGQHGGYGASSGPEPELEDYYEAGGGGRMNKLLFFRLYGIIF
jgi:hypothetical protein